MKHSRLEKVLRAAAELAVKTDPHSGRVGGGLVGGEQHGFLARMRLATCERYCRSHSAHLADSLQMIRTGKTLAELEAERLAAAAPKLAE